MFQINEHLLELFQTHGIEAVLRDGWIAFPNHTMRANASIVRESEQHGGMSVRLDVRLEIALGRIIVESFAGLGETRDEAVADALHNFTANSFHVFLAAFFRPNDPQVTQEEWVIGGRTSRVTIGNMGIRGKLPAHSEHLPGFFKRLEDKLKASPLRPGTHWVRLYYGQMGRKALAGRYGAPRFAVS